MSRTINKLTDRKIQSFKTAGRQSDGGGLYVRVSTTGAKTFSFRWVREGQTTETSLGPYPAVSLAAARDQAAEFRSQLAAGQNPSKIEASIESVPTFKDAADVFLASIEKGFKNEKHRAQWRMTLGPSYCKPLLQMKVDTISISHILPILQPIWLLKAETAYRLRGRIERVLDFARVKGWRTGENPARWRGNLDTILPSTHKIRNTNHFEALAYEDLPAFFAELNGR
ncbi:MAG: tyrosine-type recombinase/integrase, partial [Notoacmeibacter sp.]